jgi:signal transduction histidine kinase/ActR/RegA family two-component response regulator
MNSEEAAGSDAQKSRAEAFDRGQNQILEMIAMSEPLADTLGSLVRLIEAQSDGMLASVLLLDEDGEHVRHGAAPSLPEAYIRAIDGAPVGSRAGSCGTAIYRKEPVIVTDILEDPLWVEYRHLVAPHSLRACWSIPIMSHGGKALGSFAMYYRDVRTPTLAERDLIDVATRIARIAIERQRTDDALRRSEERYRVLSERERVGREQLERLRTAGLALTSTLDLPQVLALILKELQSVVPYDSASLQELKGDHLEIIGGRGFTRPEEIVGVKFDIMGSDNPNREVVRRRAPVVVDDAPATYPAFASGVHAKTPIRSWIGVPLLSGDRLIGMLALDKKEVGFYTAQHARLAESFAAPAAIAMENARLYAAAQSELEERTKIEARFLQAQKIEAVGRLAGGIAHDFNNLIGVITGYCHLLERDIGLNHPGSGRVEQIRKAAERAAGLTQQLLAFTRQQILQPKVLNLNTVVTDIEKMLRRLIGENVQLIVALGSPVGVVQADPGQMDQLIINLAVNGRDAMPQGGRLIIETANVDLDEKYARMHAGARAGPHVMLVVRDTGHGMDTETMSRVFEPFFTTKELGKGTGLGLATVYGIVKQSAGYITVESEEGRGSAFTIYLPRVDGKVAEPIATNAVPGPPLEGSETILLVEDEPSLRDVAREILEAAGYLVLESTSPEDALSKGRSHTGTIDLLLTDVVMPRMSGRVVAEALKAFRPETRVLYMSGYTDEAISHQGALNPGTQFLQKPFTADRLLLRVRETLDEPRPAGAPKGGRAL